MAPAEISGVAQTLPVLSTVKSNTSQQDDKGVVNSNTSTVPGNYGTPIQVDTVSITSQSRQAIADVKKEDAKKENVNKDNNNKDNNNGQSNGATAKVQFVYDMKGELITKYMDSANRLVYQVPSELMLHLAEAAARSDSTVDTKA